VRVSRKNEDTGVPQLAVRIRSIIKSPNHYFAVPVPLDRVVWLDLRAAAEASQRRYLRYYFRHTIE